MKPQLCPCPSCARHIRVVETACPFCRAALPDSFRLGPSPDRSTRLLSRAALFALGASLMGAPACDGDAKTPGDGSAMDSKGSGGSGGGAGGSGGSTDAGADKGSGGSGGSDAGGSDSSASDVASDGADSAVDRGGPVVIYGAASAPR